ncbi:uncharacterized protein LOC113564115 [Drosophila erecta]|uniref:uncharacterized protein LOC113564115 n=1 Tax=Drosophila erecta TaxID=7220 RepID=UPI000F072747|nr:uncharacterized protein LOC113564115 [Drosophila erecta]
MHIFELALICFWLAFAESCEKFCARNFKPVCGFDGHCYAEAVNACHMRNLNCQRVASNKPVFEVKREKACLKYLTICKILPED